MCLLRQASVQERKKVKLITERMKQIDLEIKVARFKNPAGTWKEIYERKN